MTLTLEHTGLAEAEAEYKLKRLAERALSLKLKKEAAEDEFAEADAAFREALAAAGKLNPDFQGVGKVHTSISPTVRYNDELAAKAIAKHLTKAQQKACYRQTLDSKMVKASLTPDQYRECQRTSGYTVKYSESEN